MNRLVLRSFFRPTFASGKELPKFVSVVPEASLPKSAPTLNDTVTQIQHKQYLEYAHRQLALNFATEKNGKTPLIKANHQNKSNLIRYAGLLLGADAVYQIVAGTYSYYCILGTIVLAGVVQAAVSASTASSRLPYIQEVNLLNNGKIQITCGSFEGNSQTLIVQKSEFKVGQTSLFENTNEVICKIKQNYVLLPSNRIVNSVKLSQILH